MNGADMIVQVLADEGVDTHLRLQRRRHPADLRRRSSATTRTAPASEEIRLIVPATEQGAGFMAAGYARSSGRVGVFARHLGPGRHQLGHADPRLPGRLGPGRAHLAARCRAPAMGTDAFQEAPGLQHHGGLRQARLPGHRRDARSRRRCARAFDIARSGRPGPVVVDIPRDVQLAKASSRAPASSPLRGYQERLDGARARRRSRAADARGVLPAARAQPSGRSSTPAAASSTATPRTSCAPSRSASASRS